MIKTKYVATRLYILVSLLSAIMLVVGVTGLKGMSGAVSGLETVYADRTVPLIDLGNIQRQLMNSYSDILRAYQHNPAYDLSKMHDHPVSEHTKRIQGNLAEIDSLWTKYMATYLTPREKELALAYKSAYDLYMAEVILPALQALDKEDYSTQVEFLKGARKLGNPTEQAMVKLIELQGTVAKEEYEKAENDYVLARNITFGVIGGGLLLGFALAFWIIRSITLPLGKVQSTIIVVERDSDFTRQVDVSSDDELGRTARAFNQLIVTMRETISSILGNVSRVSVSVGSMAAASSQVASSSAHQSEAASAMAAAVEQLTVSINHVSDSARDALELSRKSGELSSQGGEVIHRAVNEMSQIATTVRQASETIEALGRQSDQVTSVVQVIKDVADQTNLLALNAAIEAARAGEQGRGFAVVADEVRKLAERTTKATEEITAMIGGMQDSSRSAVTTMESAVARVGSGVTLAEQAGQSINQIKAGTEQVIHVVNDIYSALAEQSQASNDIAAHVEQVAQMTEENSAAAGASARSAEELEGLVGDMSRAVSKFKI
ncbi:MAG: HAMP domain-containing methyl-accepting chemotaxis protein [Polaromonas sp.]|uniref:methyl-accepting chemotaxis protein n=1 Tax=Polaromonas sp. TaxID=1869339 RepID=UPI002721BDFF|nr:HAMP domain-containing methyl-accepting chemotaxis protein [Polaromonas sp.]MDO9114402.1 HAMP domain-containing methyl-accepting chemotaxis protein [Polaromonas sp.]MDP2197551.1 HAMP domain-containing methyl-accepting chemotaxis protein [Sulfurimicrobium sp.]MDP3686850.1 HAMP domain-containing methyl-accepting chemotaxis protein [Sulfurimicrobium sp.]MDZ7655003.1 HAMP domain-containing methyl-accepting chemotaxis protein [Sulfurimicrobium sp.]